MSSPTEHPSGQTEASCFGFLPLPVGTRDASHNAHFQPLPSEQLEQHNSDADYLQDIGAPHSSFELGEQTDILPHGATPHELNSLTLSPLSSVPSLSAPPSSDPLLNVPQHLFHSSPPVALDLANASLEMTFAENIFDGYTSFPMDPNASSYTPFKETFDMSALNDFPDPSDSALSSSSLLLSPLPPLSIQSLSGSTACNARSTDFSDFLSPPIQHRPSVPRASASDDTLITRARLYSPRFPAEHKLDAWFVRKYLPGDELGAGGYGFVMTARDRLQGHEVAVKFIVKSKVPDHAWANDEYGRLIPSEVLLLCELDHPNIVRCIEYYEDDLYYYLVQELHGTPWMSKKEKKAKQPTAPGSLAAPSASSPPLLTSSLSTDSMLDSVPPTPSLIEDVLPSVSVSTQSPTSPGQGSSLFVSPQVPHRAAPTSNGQQKGDSIAQREPQDYLQPPLPLPMHVRPSFSRRPSYDLFECIEQSKHKRLSENQARYIFAQVVEAVYYLDSRGVTHCDIKDENLLVDSDLKVKLIDFGSAVWVEDPSASRPYLSQFYGTTAYASSEILRKQPYRAPPAEIWTLGVLLSYLLTGHSPFPKEEDAAAGRIVLREPGSTRLSRAAISLMQRCLERDPDRRADIMEVHGHRWLVGALERGGQD